MALAAYTTIEGRACAETVEKKSRFIAQLAHVETEEEALAFLEGVRAGHRMARHNVYAYCLREGGRVRYSDDGEPQRTAGLPTLEAIQHAGLTDVAVVTTRYFGGVLLGTGGLVRAYAAAAAAGIDAAHKVVVSRCTEVVVHLSYPLYEQALRIAEGCGAHVQATDFSAEVTLRLRLPADTEQPLIDQLANLSRGQAAVAVSEPFYAAF